jgi:Ca2+-binding EF-hand superfamily protein
LVALVERFDANADQRLSSDELPDSLRTRLAEFDPNRDGFLDLDEARRIDTARAQAESQPRRRRTLAGLVTFMDTDGDGLLQKKEAPLRIQRVFEQFDRNRDGAIDPGEAKAVDDAAKDRGP